MRSTISRSSLLLLALSMAGCADPEARFAEFIEATEEQRGMMAPMDEGPTLMILPDITGTYLFALEASTLAPGLPLQFRVTIDMTSDPDDMSATAEFAFTPLSLDPSSITAPRECLLDQTLVFSDVAIDSEGNYEIDMGIVMVPAEANPISGFPIETTLILSGHIVDEDAQCGSFDGDVSSPVEYMLDGSNFAAVRLADDGCTPATLPTEVAYSCASLPTAP